MKRTTRRLHIASGSLPLDEWVHCMVSCEVEQCSSRTDNTKMDPVIEDNGEDVRTESTTISLLLNWQIVKEVRAEGGRSPLYQNIVLGTIPRNLKKCHLDNELAICDIYWRPFALHEPECSTYRMSMEPPSLLMSSIKDAMVTSRQILKAIASSLLLHHFGWNNAPSGNSIPSGLLVQVPVISKFALEAICLGDEDVQYVAFSVLRSLLVLLPVMEESESRSSSPSPTSGHSTPSSPLGIGGSPLPVGSAVKAAQMTKAATSLKSVTQDLLSLVDSLHDDSTLEYSLSLGTDCNETCLQIWALRRRITLTSHINEDLKFMSPEWSSPLVVDVGTFVTSVSTILATSIERSGQTCDAILNTSVKPSSVKTVDDQSSIPSKGLVFPSMNEDEESPSSQESVVMRNSRSNSGEGHGRTMCALLMGGGLPIKATLNHVVSVQPAPLFSVEDIESKVRGDRCLFGDEVSVAHASSRLGLLARHKFGTFFTTNSNVMAKCVGLKVPKPSSIAVVPFHRLGSVRLPFRTIHLNTLKLTLHFRVPSANELMEFLKRSMSRGIPKTVEASDCSKNDRSAGFIDKVLDSTLLSPSKIDVHAAEDPNGPAVSTSRRPCAGKKRPPSLAFAVAHLRCILAQISDLGGLAPKARKEQMLQLVDLLEEELPNIIALSEQNAGASILGLFETYAQASVVRPSLQNIIEEEDVKFLERVALESSRFFDGNGMRFSSDRKTSMSKTADNLTLDMPTYIQMTAISGEVQIQDNKVRALTHFPSLKLAGTNISNRSGRWFYECCLLTDGLMQIGWADTHFRCDPVCGQGVGDHVHSWALDGLRVKKWNVSCESYGKRWHMGDTVGVLVDMDLMEMRFYLNGEDLGSAFSNFKVTSIYPAISLNVRQSARVNFGQFKFMYPPDEVDGKAYRPILDAISKTATSNSSKVKANRAPSPLALEEQSDYESSTLNITAQTPARVARVEELHNGIERSLLTNDERRSIPFRISQLVRKKELPRANATVGGCGRRF